MFLDKIISNIESNPDKKFLTICNSEKIEYSYKDLKDGILKHMQVLKGYENQVVVCIDKHSINLFSFFIASLLCRVKPCFYSFPSPKQSEQQFFESFKGSLTENRISNVFIYENKYINFFNKNNSKINVLKLKKQKNNWNLNTSFASKKNSYGKKFLQFSSGTTGHKKIIQVDNDKLVNHIKIYNNTVNLNENSVVVSWLPHYHDMGLVACMLMPLYLNSKIVMMSPFDWVKQPLMLLKEIQKEKGTHVWLPNFAFGIISKSLKKDFKNEKFDLSSLQFVTSASEPVIYETMLEFNKVTKKFNYNSNIFNNLYGMAENIFAITSTKNNFKYLNINYESLKNGNIRFDNPNFKIACAGVPIKNVSIRILNNKKKCNDLKVGSIHLKSSHLMDGYVQNNYLQNKLDWFDTGDLGFTYKGDLYVTGRKKDTIIVGGENINPVDIEKILNENKYLIKGRNVAFGNLNKKIHTEEIIILAEILKENIKKININDIKKEIYNKLNVVIKELYLLNKNTLFKSTAGKISREINKNKFIEKKILTVNLSSRKKSKFNIVSTIITKISNKENFTSHTNLFQEGILDSFNFVELLLELEKKLNIKINMDDLNYQDFSTVNKINTFLDNPYKKKINKQLDKNYINSKKNLLKNLKYDKSKIYNNKSQTKFKLTLFQKFLIKLLESSFNRNWFKKFIFRMLRIKIGKNVTFQGPVYLKVRGPTNNIIFGSNILIGRNLDLRIREKGRIIISDNCYLDNNIRMVASRNSSIKVNQGVSIGANTIINGGADINIGELSMIGSNVNINSSEHQSDKHRFIKSQPYYAMPINICEDVWIGSGVSILRGSNLKKGTIISSNSLVSGETKELSIYAGVPAKFVRTR